MIYNAIVESGLWVKIFEYKRKPRVSLGQNIF